VDPKQVKAGMIAWWRIEEGSGALLTDSVGGAQIRFPSPLRWGANRGPVGRAAAITERGLGAHASRLEGHQALTIAVWVRVHDTEGAGGTIIGQREHWRFKDGPNIAFHLGLGVKGNQCYPFGEVASLKNRLKSARGFPENEWHHIAFVFDGRQPKNRRQQIYIDGVLVETGPAEQDRVPITKTRLCMGMFPKKKRTSLKADLDEIRIYNRPLTATQLRGLIQTTRRR
jgi:hypothetical protein